MTLADPFLPMFGAPIAPWRTCFAWRPIETAPKDGKGGPYVLLTNGEYIYIGFWNGQSFDDGDFYDDLGEMTHWMPLPPPPVCSGRPE